MYEKRNLVKRDSSWDPLTGYLSFEKTVEECLRETEPMRYWYWRNTNGYKPVKTYEKILKK